MNEQNPIILFDGYCNLCNSWIDFIIKRDKRTREKRWSKTEDEVIYNASELDRKVTSKDQIRKMH